MPKATNRESIQKFNARMVQKFPNILAVEASTLYCKLCHCNFNGTKIFSIQQHFRTMKHQAALQSALGSQVNSVLTTPPPAVVQIKLETFSLDLCTTFLEANIPLETIDNPAIQIFLQKYTKKSIPNESSLRSNYVPALYEKYIQTLQHKAANKQIWLSITETVDSEQQLIANFVFGLMGEEEKGKSYLLNMARLERANASSLAAFINNSLQLLWPEGIHYENVLLVVTPAIAYMKTALQSLKVLYPNMIYVNCLLQSYHKMLEDLRFSYQHVDKFINNCEEVFLKSPHRQHIMRTNYPHLNLPSITNGSSNTLHNWLKAALYYHTYLNEMKALIKMLYRDEHDSLCLQSLQLLIQFPTLEQDFDFIKEHFESLDRSITQLETRDLTLNESLATIDLIKTNIQNTEFVDKFKKIIDKNEGLQELIAANEKNNLFTKNEIADENWSYKYAPVVASNVEQLKYAKSLLENNKTLSLRNLKQEKYEFTYYN